MKTGFVYLAISLSGVLELQNSRVRTQMVNIHFLLFYCILLCAPEQREQIQAITIKSGHMPWLSDTIMMRILMRHLSKTPHHPHSSATTCHPKWGLSCLPKAHCTVTLFGPSLDFYRLSSVQTEADKQVRSKGLGWLLSLTVLRTSSIGRMKADSLLYSTGKDHGNLDEHYQLKLNKCLYSFCFYLWKWIYFNLYKPCIG